MNIYQQALDKWGVTSQVMMAVGECGEFSAAAIQWGLQGKIGDAELITEVADVIIMMEQMRLILGPEAVDAEKARKLERLQGIIDGSVHHPHQNQTAKQ